VTDVPWRAEPRTQVTGLSARGLQTAASSLQPLRITGLAGVTPEWAWGDSDGGGVRACVVDSGVEGSHPMVGGLERSVSVVADPDGGLVMADVAPEDSAGHGTACAGLIRSVAPAVTLTSVRVLTDGVRGTGAALLAGLGWAIDEGFDVINLSLATSKPEFGPALYELADRAYFRRSILVVSAHNMLVRSYPWTFASVVSVASHDEPDPMTYYYNPSPPAEFLARGLKVQAAWRGGGQMAVTGNSFASPHISGICALILSKHPWLTPFQLKSVLYLLARNVASMQGGEHDPR
jgi:subtilisin